MGGVPSSMQEGRVGMSVWSVEIKPERVGRPVLLARLAAGKTTVQAGTLGTSSR